MASIPWSAVVGCFTPHAPDPHEFTRSMFHPEYLQEHLDASLGAGAVAVPDELVTAGYADETERVRYAREVVVPKLAALGVEVAGVPPRDRIRERYYHGTDHPVRHHG